MADIVSKEMRSKMMSGIRGRGNQSTEIRLAKIFRMRRFTGWRRGLPLIGKPDFVFQKYKLVVFVDGCFWHGCPKCYKRPEDNRKFWDQKLENNKKRDKIVTQALVKSGWKVLRIWECSLSNEESVANHIARRM